MTFLLPFFLSLLLCVSFDLSSFPFKYVPKLREIDGETFQVYL